MIIKSGILMIHKILETGKPEYLREIFITRNRRVAQVALKFYPRAKKFRNYHLHRSLRIYNRLDSDLKCLNTKQLRYKLKQAPGLIPDSYD